MEFYIETSFLHRGNINQRERERKYETFVNHTDSVYMDEIEKVHLGTGALVNKKKYLICGTVLNFDWTVYFE